MRSRLIAASLLTFVLISLASAQSSRAVVYETQPVYTILCDRISIAEQVFFNPSRDTTGTGAEILSYRVTDGSGAELFSTDDTLQLSFGFPYTATSFFISQPAYNPIRLLIYSPGGNGFATEVYFDQSSTCEGLPTYVPTVTPGGSAYYGLMLPATRNLVLALGDIAVLESADGNAVGSVIHQCQTVFITSTSQDELFGRVFVMGGWISLENTVDVAEDYGQPGGQARYPGCENK